MHALDLIPRPSDRRVRESPRVALPVDAVDARTRALGRMIALAHLCRNRSCIMAEMMLTRALFTGAEAKGNELQQDQLMKVALLGCAIVPGASP